jgi:hypothetical protein
MQVPFLEDEWPRKNAENTKIENAAFVFLAPQYSAKAFTTDFTDKKRRVFHP